MTNTAQRCSRVFVATAKNETLGLSEHPEEEVPDLLVSIAKSLDKLCTELALLDNAMKKYLANRAESKIQGAR